MMPIVKIAEADIAAGLAWAKTEAELVWAWAEPVAAQALTTFATVVRHDLIGAASAMLQALGKVVAGGMSLADLETMLLNILSGLSATLLAAAQAATSNLLQTIIGALLTKL